MVRSNIMAQIVLSIQDICRREINRQYARFALNYWIKDINVAE